MILLINTTIQGSPTSYLLLPNVQRNCDALNQQLAINCYKIFTSLLI